MADLVSLKTLIRLAPRAGRGEVASPINNPSPFLLPCEGRGDFLWLEPINTRRFKVEKLR
jgi:hypothetical protein